MALTAVERQQRVKANRRTRAVQYLGTTCAQCGATEVQFDHRDPSTKVIAIADAIGRCWSWERLRVELDKCQLLCTACHRRKTALEARQRRVPRHGTPSEYSRHGCRCSLCREWKRRSRNQALVVSTDSTDRS